MRDNMIRENVQSGEYYIQHVRGENSNTDMFTKEDKHK